MVIAPTFLASLEIVHPSVLAGELLARNFGGSRTADIKLTNEITPVDLFCYLFARFGEPNGMQSFFRKDDSDNLFHWQWTLRGEGATVSIHGMNFRSEIQVSGVPPWTDDDCQTFLAQIKADIAGHRRALSHIRKQLENWTEFVNPYQRIRRSVDRLLADLDELELAADAANTVFDLWSDADRERWERETVRYSGGYGLCFGIRSMLPVLAESYVNLLLYILARPEIKNDDRLWQNVLRQPIDIRIKTLAINCIGFETQPDYGTDACKNFHRLVNERNDLLHGNVVIDKLKFNEVHFWGKVPVFREYRTFWQRTLEVEKNAVGFDRLRSEVDVVRALTAYLLSCLHEQVRLEVQFMTERYDLGFNTTTRRLGVLFPDHLVDFKVEAHPPADQAPDARGDEDTTER